MPVLLGLCLEIGKFPASDTNVRKSIGSIGYWMIERAVVPLFKLKIIGREIYIKNYYVFFVVICNLNLGDSLLITHFLSIICKL